MSPEEPHGNLDFEHVDADAVCEQCGTVNPEGTLICKSCGNNLRDQRNRRIAGENIQLMGGGISGFRIFTGLLTVLGIVIVLLAAYSVQNVETWLTGLQSQNQGSAQAQLWSGKDAAIYSQLQDELDRYPSTDRQREVAVANPLDEDSYNGRYALALRSGGGKMNVIGEASLSRRGTKVFFVANINRNDTEIRGFAEFQGDRQRLVSNQTAGIRTNGKEYIGFGFSQKLAGGGHLCLAQTSLNPGPLEIHAYRIR
ncbi:MAG: hypothetical protein IIB38_16655 [Candidatus Hydrogenedentes bacterium]|nr:hypothetical protein [Candidatus Hydrogenedentota bacterium]